MIDFLGIGAQKAGTTWLFERLNENPQIHFPAGKEVHFWDTYPQNGKNLNWWLELFPADSFKRKQGEITPAYALFDQPKIKKLKDLLPDLLFFYSIRNPIARAWSQAMMALRIGRLAGIPYNEAVVADFLKSPGVRGRGDYVSTITNWAKVFPPEQLHIIVFDDIISQPAAVLTALCQFLGGRRAINKTTETVLTTPVFAGPQWDVPIPLLDLLRMQYRPVIERMPELIGRDVSHWLEWDGRRSSATSPPPTPPLPTIAIAAARSGG